MIREKYKEKSGIKKNTNKKMRKMIIVKEQLGFLQVGRTSLKKV